MVDQVVPPRWASSGWLEEVEAWIRRQVAELGSAVTGPVEQPHLMAWSTVLRVPTTRGNVYFKEPAPMLRYEVAVTSALVSWHPNALLPLLAADVERGWMLMPDGGTRLREVIRTDRDIGHWERILPVYADLQIEMVPHYAELLELGAPDHRLERLPEILEAVLSDREAMRLGQSDGLTPEQYERVTSLLPRVRRELETLAAYGIPQSLDHGDLHDANIFLQKGRYALFDWSDCSLTHPFFSVRNAMVSAEKSLGLEEDEPFETLRDAYIEPWKGYLSRDELIKAFEVVRKVWMIPVAAKWHQHVTTMEGDDRERYAYTVPAVLEELLAAYAE